MTDAPKAQFKRWLFSPPRPHGAVIKDRTVSNLELFYDLVYVAVIGQASHHLAEHVSLEGFVEFAIVFTMLWFAWFNGSLYIELHGREDGRTRLQVFFQMGILALLAVFTAEAAGSTGPQFALVYAVFLAFMGWQWYAIRELDRVERPEFLRITAFYVGGMALSTVVVGATAAFPEGPWRLLVWAVFAAGWLLFMLLGSRSGRQNEGILPTDSLVERFGLFTIIVLGEVIFGVVDGLSAAGPDALTIATGSLAMVIGFGLWWIYFDLVGRRLPRTGGPIWTWMLSHLPIQLAIVAAGAGIVNLIEHAHEPTTPGATALLLGGSVALGLLALIVTERELEDAVRLEVVYRPLGAVLATGAAIALLAGWLAPAPWVLAVLLVAILTALWFFVVARMIRAGVWGQAITGDSALEPTPLR
ncbi:MAG TPA: low temperature requirement protein A [Patescibacteria group bacterium]|jgi:low temperature requirement protein LtrA|nr:low temperature requirement protein A [Patescibacteria group bacterium]